MWVRLWSDASYMLAAEAQRKDYVVELVSEDVFTHNDQVVKQLTMISDKTTIKEAKQSIQCVWNDDRRSANIFSELSSWRLGNGRNPRCSWNRMLGGNRIPDEKPDAWWWKTGCLVMVPKGDIARRTMSVCTQQCMAVFWVRRRYTTCDMWMLIYRWNYANRSCMNMLDWQFRR